MHLVRCAKAFALARAGSNIAARIAMIAMTTKSSINVNASKRDAHRLRLISTRSEHFLHTNLKLTYLEEQ
jgi:hypothetical protein